MRNKIVLSIIIPCYNEAETIEKVVKQSVQEALEITSRFEIIVANDGSTDATAAILKRLLKQIPQLMYISHKKNTGLGQTLIDLFEKSRGQYIQTLPGDLQMRPKEIPKFYNAIQTADLVCGVRMNRQDSILRLIVSKVYNISLKFFFGIKISDSGSIKMIRRKVLDKIFPLSNSNYIEAEMVVKTQKMGFKVVQIPIDYFPRKYGKATGGSLKNILKIIRDIINT